MHIAIHSRKFSESQRSFFEYLFQEFKRRSIETSVSVPLAEYLVRGSSDNVVFHHTFNSYDNLNGINFVMSIGGDGTMLETITFVRDRKLPIIGVNIGRLGFLATIAAEKISEALDAICSGQYVTEARTLVEVETSKQIFGINNFGLNDFTILKRDTSSMIMVKTYLNGEYLNSYWADGLIVSTPTGSTGYSLSAGGPIVSPDSNTFVISPVSPHNLNVRPLIVSDESVISFEIQGRSKNFLVSLDSRSRKVDSSIEIAVKKCSFPAILARLKDDSFFSTLRKKLNWGLDIRN